MTRYSTRRLRPARMTPGRLVILANTGQELFNLTLPGQGDGGNGIGVAAVPSVVDLDGDGTLKIVVLSFDHGVAIFTVPGSGTQCLPWPTGRGNLLRNGQGAGDGQVARPDPLIPP